MTSHALGLLVVLLAVVVTLAGPLGAWMARVYAGEVTWGRRVERTFYRLAGVREDDEMSWKQYAAALLVFHVVGLLAVYALQRLQGALPVNPAHLGAVDRGVAVNTAVSFVTNTNWQSYGGETTMSHLTQLLGLTVQNFVSAASGMAVMVALVRGFARKQAGAIGNFWVDLTRGTLYVLLPLAVILAIALVSQGVVQTFAGSTKVSLLEGGEQVLALGPAASQVAIKQLGTNGGGFFNVNSAHPFENPTPLANFLELVSILLIPAALCLTFGRMVGDRRQGWVLLGAMVLLFVPITLGMMAAEHAPNPALTAAGVEAVPSLEGKEVRLGADEATLWAAATTAASNGSVNAMHDSLSPLAGLGAMALMQLGEVVFGGVGSGVYGLVLFALVAVFVAGLMVGRTPEYLGKKIEAGEMKLVVLAILLPSCAVLIGTAIACLLPSATAAVANPGAHGFGEILYAFSSGANNNGSAFGGLTVSGTFYTLAIGAAMLVGRFGVILPVLAIAGGLAAKKIVPPSAGTLPTHRPLFLALLAGTVVLVGALTFVPALALGPIVEHVQLHGGGR